MATEDPYAAPASPVADPVPEIPADILKKIKYAWVCAIISGCITLGMTLLAMSGNSLSPLSFSAWELIDVGLIFGLAFGIYRRSRTCAVLMLLYWIAAKILIMVELGKATGLPMALVFGYFFWQGIVGTFAFHRLANAKPAFVASGG